METSETPLDPPLHQSATRRSLLCELLASTPSELDIIVVRKKGAADSQRDFRVRRVVILRALQWLLANNQYYRISPDALALLPEDGNLTGLGFCDT